MAEEGLAPHKLKILLVEDEMVIVHFLSTILGAEGYHVIYATKGEEGAYMAASHRPDLLLLDLSLPDMDGLDVLKAVRAWSDMPIIVVSARAEEREKVAALDSGANDYVTKPFGNSELLARIRSALRLYMSKKNARGDGGGLFSAKELRLDYVKRTLTVSGSPVRLTPTEYKILVLLSQNAGRVLTHDFIIRKIWGPYASDSQVLRVNMANIRRKIEPNPADPQYILTEVGVGYRMTDDPKAPGDDCEHVNR
ncbi:MAG: response regulator transcription factor [Clostridiales bacterium]|jgi:two-component system KDP operon response regulator KdpE|nr:response regulator transcription factor [Clostridiales bacterium]